MAPLPTLQPPIPERRNGTSAPRRRAEDDETGVSSDAPVRMLNVVTHFMKGDGELHLGLKIKLPAKYDDRTVREAVVDPFVEAYDKRHPDYPASKFRPFSRVKVLVWAGPLHSSADHYREKDRPWADDIQEAEQTARV